MERILVRAGEGRRKKEEGGGGKRRCGDEERKFVRVCEGAHDAVLSLSQRLLPVGGPPALNGSVTQSRTARPGHVAATFWRALAGDVEVFTRVITRQLGICWQLAEELGMYDW